MSPASKPPSLTGKQRRYLRALAHPLKPVVRIGHSGLTAPVLEQIDVALETHELIKVRISGEDPETAAIARGVEEGTRSVVAQVIGKTLIVYRRRKKKPTISLPKASDGAHGD